MQILYLNSIIAWLVLVVLVSSRSVVLTLGIIPHSKGENSHHHYDKDNDYILANHLHAHKRCEQADGIYKHLSEGNNVCIFIHRY
jgi:hypothetical protein